MSRFLTTSWKMSKLFCQIQAVAMVITHSTNPHGLGILADKNFTITKLAYPHSICPQREEI